MKNNSTKLDDLFMDIKLRRLNTLMFSAQLKYLVKRLLNSNPFCQLLSVANKM